MPDVLIVLCTCENQQQAAGIAEALVEGRLAACVNVLPGIQSVYRWKGAVERAEEVLLLIKTTRELFAAVQERIEELHSYEVPEVIALPVIEGSETYLLWLREQVAMPPGE